MSAAEDPSKTVHTWTLDNFSTYTKERDRKWTSFTLKSDAKVKFQLDLYPNGTQFYTAANTLISLWLCASSDVKYNCKLSILKQDGQEWMTVESIVARKDFDGFYSFSNHEMLINRAKILAEKDLVLQNDKLIIRCEITERHKKKLNSVKQIQYPTIRQESISANATNYMIEQPGTSQKIPAQALTQALVNANQNKIAPKSTVVKVPEAMATLPDKTQAEFLIAKEQPQQLTNWRWEKSISQPQQLTNWSRQKSYSQLKSEYIISTFPDSHIYKSSEKISNPKQLSFGSFYTEPIEQCNKFTMEFEEIPDSRPSYYNKANETRTQPQTLHQMSPIMASYSRTAPATKPRSEITEQVWPLEIWPKTEQTIPREHFSVQCEMEPEIKNVQKDLHSLIEESTLSDVVCEVGGKVYRLHRNILAARSPVFKTMFKNPAESKSGRIKITGVSLLAFDQALPFIYAGKNPDLKLFAGELYEFSVKYQLESLKSMCEEALDANLDMQSVITTLLLADSHNIVSLKQKCIEFIQTHPVNLMNHKNWRQLKSNTKLVIELYNTISLDPECVISVLLLADSNKSAELKAKCIQFIKTFSVNVMRHKDWKQLEANSRLVIELYKVINLDNDCVIAILQLADFRKESELKTKCIHYIKTNQVDVFKHQDWYNLKTNAKLVLGLFKLIDLSVSSVISILLLADLNEDSELKRKCIEFIKANTEAVKMRGEWQRLSDNLLLELYKVIDLSADSAIPILVLADTARETILKEKCIEYIRLNAGQIQLQDLWSQLIDKSHLLLDVYKVIELDIETVIDILLLADSQQEDELKKKCINFMRVHKEEVKKQPQWEQLPRLFADKPLFLVELLMGMV